MKVTQIPPVYAANLVANSGNTAYRVGGIMFSTMVHVRIMWQINRNTNYWHDFLGKT